MSKGLKKVVSLVKKTAFPLEILPESVQQFAYPIIGSAVGGPAGGAIASGINSWHDTGNIKNALLSAGGSYLGSNLGGQFLGNLGTVGGTVNSALGTTLGETAANALPNQAIASLWGSPLNSALGSSIGTSLASSLVPQTAGNVQGEGAFKPSQQAEQTTPLSLQSMGSLTPSQLSTNLATGGVYGGGNGPEEQSYFLNLLNRRLVDKKGKVDQNLEDINPIEKSYLAQLGLGNYSNTTDLLKLISQYQA